VDQSKSESRAWSDKQGKGVTESIRIPLNNREESAQGGKKGDEKQSGGEGDLREIESAKVRPGIQFWKGDSGRKNLNL